MSSRKRCHGDSGPSGADTDDGNCNPPRWWEDVDENGDPVIFVEYRPNLDVLVQQPNGVLIKAQSLARKERRRKQRERERRRNEEPEPPEKAAVRLKAEEQKRQADAAKRLEVRRQAYIEQTGEDICIEEFKRVEENEKQQRRQSGKSLVAANGQTRVDAFFRPKSGGGVAPSQSNVDTVTERKIMPETLPQCGSEEGGEPAVASVTPTDDQGRVAEKMYLRLAFLRKDEIDKMKATPAGTAIRKTEMIGPVLVEGLDGETAAKVDSSQFQTLRDPGKRNGGKEIDAKTFKALQQALGDADWKVDRKYLSQRYRTGENNHWTPAQVKIVIDAVEGKGGMAGLPSMSGTRSWDQAVKYLRETQTMSAGFEWKGITRGRVKYVYTNRDKLTSGRD
jgi:hypothetical protein